MFDHPANPGSAWGLEDVRAGDDRRDQNVIKPHPVILILGQFYRASAQSALIAKVASQSSPS
jgi:hypothetical protein